MLGVFSSSRKQILWAHKVDRGVGSASVFYWNTREEAVVSTGGIWEYFPERGGLEPDVFQPRAGWAGSGGGSKQRGHPRSEGWVGEECPEARRRVPKSRAHAGVTRVFGNSRCSKSQTPTRPGRGGSSRPGPIASLGKVSERAVTIVPVRPGGHTFDMPVVEPLTVYRIILTSLECNPRLACSHLPVIFLTGLPLISNA